MRPSLDVMEEAERERDRKRYSIQRRIKEFQGSRIKVIKMTHARALISASGATSPSMLNTAIGGVKEERRKRGDRGLRERSKAKRKMLGLDKRCREAPEVHLRKQKMSVYASLVKFGKKKKNVCGVNE